MGAAVFVADEQSAEPVETGRWVLLAEGVLGAQGAGDDVEVSLIFVDETSMAELNRRFLGRDGPTDVLAFPIDDDAYEGGRALDSLGPMGPSVDEADSDLPSLLGDVVVCPSVARRNAPTHAGTYDDEMALLIVHGILHLMGMDHLDATEATEMEKREQELLDRFHRS